MDALYTAYALIGSTLLVLVFLQQWLRRFLWISAPLFAVLVGIAAGPLGAGLLDPRP